MMELIVSALSGAVTPALLLGCGALFSARLGFFWVLHPVRTFRALFASPPDGGHSPARALTVALAGTLGVGNIAGVATAITAGGAGAVFWMLLSAALAMGVKYAEVAFALAHRRRERITNSADNAPGSRRATDADSIPGSARTSPRRPRYRYSGGAMYYINDSVSPAAGGVFALLCLANAAVTGNVIQTNAAASVFPDVPPVTVGIAFALLTLAVTSGSARRVSDVTVRLIPALAALYVALSVWVIASNISAVPGVLARIFREAFGLRAAGGGAAGTGVALAMRFGVTRGILSNEAGSGTSPTAHAAADTDDPHRQGVFGVFEVFADTVVLCTLTALVILLLPDSGGEDGVRLAARAYGFFAGGWAGAAICASVVLFAFATVICQAYYGEVALGFFTRSAGARRAYLAAYSALCVVGSVIDAGRMWLCADLVISLMTALNVAALLFAFARRRYRRELLPWAYRRK